LLKEPNSEATTSNSILSGWDEGESFGQHCKFAHITHHFIVFFGVLIEVLCWDEGDLCNLIVIYDSKDFGISPFADSSDFNSDDLCGYNNSSI